jgi:hypothetical protein
MIQKNARQIVAVPAIQQSTLPVGLDCRAGAEPVPPMNNPDVIRALAPNAVINGTRIQRRKAHSNAKLLASTTAAQVSFIHTIL